MPFSHDFTNQWEFAFVPAIEASSLKAVRADEDSLGTNMIMRDVTAGIYEAQLILADLTGRNPNVMYELGLAHAAKKPVIILAQDEKDISFDIKHIRYIIYDPRDLKTLRLQLERRIAGTLSMDNPEEIDFFPELRIMKAEDLRELAYLRECSQDLIVRVFPPTAEIFFNDRYIGIAPQTIHVNPRAERSVLAITAPEHVEYYEGSLPRSDILRRDLR